jgi:hypothetical protein
MSIAQEERFYVKANIASSLTVRKPRPVKGHFVENTLLTAQEQCRLSLTTHEE